MEFHSIDVILIANKLIFRIEWTNQRIYLSDERRDGWMDRAFKVYLEEIIIFCETRNYEKFRGGFVGNLKQRDGRKFDKRWENAVANFVSVLDTSDSIRKGMDKR